MKKKNKRFAKLKKVLAGFMALVLVVGLTIAGTLAYLSTKSNKVTNVFTATGNIALKLIEPSFNAEEASKFKPAGEYPKDPTLVNTTGGDGSSEWVILRVDYMVSPNTTSAYSNVSQADITHTQSGTKLEASAAKGLINIEHLAGTGWLKLDLSASWLTNAANVKQAGSESAVGQNAICEFYVYKKALTSTGDLKNKSVTDLHGMTIGENHKTTPLFDKIVIKSQEQLEMNGYSMDNLPRFKIDVVGGAIKNEGDDSTLTDGNTELSLTDTKSQKIIDNLLGLVADKTPNTDAGSSSSLGQ